MAQKGLCPWGVPLRIALADPNGQAVPSPVQWGRHTAARRLDQQEAERTEQTLTVGTSAAGTSTVVPCRHRRTCVAAGEEVVLAPLQTTVVQGRQVDLWWPGHL